MNDPKTNDAISRSAVLGMAYCAIKPTHENPSVVSVVNVEDIEQLPALDVAPVVRCKDCKHWGMLEGPPETESVKCCEFGQYMVGANGYCVYGEVKDDD